MSDSQSLHEHGWQIYWSTVTCDHAALRDLLVSEHKSSPIVQDDQRWTPLHRAALKGCDECTRLLLQGGCNPDVQDILGQTPLLLASMNHHHAVMRSLLQAGCQADLANREGRTPLHEVAAENDTEGIKLLLEDGCNLNLCDSSGNTPLMLTCVFSHRRSACLLMCYGADVYVRKRGHTVLDLSLKNQDHVIVRRILQCAGTDRALRQLAREAVESVARKYGIRMFSAFIQAISTKHVALVRPLKASCLDFPHEDCEWMVWLFHFTGHKLDEGHPSVMSLLKRDKPDVRRAAQTWLREPLTLLGLCRVKIRSCLPGSVTSSVWYLQLPALYVRYILLQDLGCDADGITDLTHAK